MSNEQKIEEKLKKIKQKKIKKSEKRYTQIQEIEHKLASHLRKLLDVDKLQNK